MRKEIETYGIKKIKWTFSRYEIEELVRKLVQESEGWDLSKFDSWNIEYDWRIDDETYEVDNLSVIRKYKFKPDEEEE